MTGQDDLDRLLGDWLAEGPARVPEAVLGSALQHARAHPRRPDPLAVLRRDPMAARRSLFGVAPVPVLASVALIVVAAIGVSLVGGQRDEAPPPVSPVPTIGPAPSPSAAPAPTPIVVGLRTASGATITVEVVDQSGLLVDARTAVPADGGSQPTGTVGVANVDEHTLHLTWTDAVCDVAYTLRIRTTHSMELTAPPCTRGDTVAMDRGLLLQFSEPVDAATVRVEVIQP